VLEHGESVASIAGDWTARGIKPVAARQWWQTSIVGTLTSPRLAGLREWQGQKYPTTQWSAIIDTDTHERLVKLFADPARRKHVVRALEFPRVQEALREGKTSTRRATRDCWSRSGTRTNGGKGPAATTPTGSSTGPTGSISGSAPRTTSAPRGGNMTGSPDLPP